MKKRFTGKSKDLRSDQITIGDRFSSVFGTGILVKAGVRVRVGLELGSGLGLDLGASESTASRGCWGSAAGRRYRTMSE